VVVLLLLLVVFRLVVRRLVVLRLVVLRLVALRLVALRLVALRLVVLRLVVLRLGAGVSYLFFYGHTAFERAFFLSLLAFAFWAWVLFQYLLDWTLILAKVLDLEMNLVHRQIVKSTLRFDFTVVF
jgi:hypothetical protein